MFSSNSTAFRSGRATGMTSNGLLASAFRSSWSSSPFSETSPRDCDALSVCSALCALASNNFHVELKILSTISTEAACRSSPLMSTPPLWLSICWLSALEAPAAAWESSTSRTRSKTAREPSLWSVELPLSLQNASEKHSNVGADEELLVPSEALVWAEAVAFSTVRKWSEPIQLQPREPALPDTSPQ